MQRSTVRRLVSVLAIAIGAACGGDSTGPGNGQPRFTAKIDGASWVSAGGVERTGVSLVLPGVYILTGTNLGGSTPYSITISLYNIIGPGTYPLGVGSSVPGGSAVVTTSTGGWYTAQTGADGTIKITTLTSTRMEGTFSFTAVAPSGGAPPTRRVTDGSFIVEVKAQGTVGPLADNAWSKVTATIDGAPYNAANVSNAFNPSTGLFNIAANSSNRFMAISLVDVPATAVGTYALGPASPNRRLTVTVLTGTEVTGFYSSSAAGGSGSLTISSLTATRIKGTFTATLGTAGGSATGTMAVTNGTFDLGRQFQ
jgi:hypothetical protein